MGKYYSNPRKPKRTGEKVTVGGVEALPPGRGATVELNDGAEIALFNVGGKFYAIENFCPHKGAPLADSRVIGQTVECELHNWRFDLASGECYTKKSCSIETYEVVVEDEMIKIVI